jgi:hypothetical protein
MKSIKSKLGLIIVAFLIAVSMFTMINPVKAYAGTSAQIKEVIEKYAPEANNSDYSGWPSKLQPYFSTAYNKDDGFTQVIEGKINGNSYEYYYNPDEASAIIAIADALDKSTEKTGEDIVNDLDEVYTLKADVKSAAGVMNGFTSVFQTFLGFIVTMLTIGMTVFTALDLCYIAFPVFRGKCDDAKANGTKGVTSTDKKTGATKLTIISEDAQFSVVSADMVNTGKSPFVIYFQKRVISFIVLAVLIFILLTGNINIITNIGVKLASGILEVINNTF